MTIDGEFDGGRSERASPACSWSAALGVPGAASAATDSDHDGLPNKFERHQSHTNPHRKDTDRDGDPRHLRGSRPRRPVEPLRVPRRHEPAQEGHRRRRHRRTAPRTPTTTASPTPASRRRAPTRARPTPTATGRATTARTPTATACGTSRSSAPAPTRATPTPTTTASATATRGPATTGWRTGSSSRSGTNPGAQGHRRRRQARRRGGPGRATA